MGLASPPNQGLSSGLTPSFERSDETGQPGTTDGLHCGTSITFIAVRGSLESTYQEFVRPCSLHRPVFLSPTQVILLCSQHNTTGFAGAQLPHVTQGIATPLGIYTTSANTGTTVHITPDSEEGCAA